MVSSVLLPYLMLVSFLTPPLDSPAVSKIRTLNDTPYQGVAVMLRCAYSTQAVHESDFQSSTRLLRLSCKKDIWPWVFFNRFIGVKEGDESTPFVAGTKLGAPFKLIEGMDLYNKAGALEDFYRTWKIALQTAQRLRSPGIVLDTEPYNNYLTSELPYLAQLTSLTVEQVRKRLEEIGEELADLADQTYPEATIWVLSTELIIERPPRTLAARMTSTRYHPSCSYIITGLLKRAAEKGSNLKIVSGGQEGLHYCHNSLEAMITTIQQRDEKFKPLLQSYKNLHLGGTIAMWDKAESKSEYFATNQRCRDSTIKTLADFEPLLRLLFTHYRYNWIYASGSWDNPYDRRISAQYNELLKRVQDSQAAQASKQ
jgi:hypothetical protein